MQLKIDMLPSEIECAIEAILFSSGEAISLEKISKVFDINLRTLEEHIKNLEDYYNFHKRGIMIMRIDNKVMLASRVDYADLIRNALELRPKANLSPAFMEVLSIIAYRQPITRAVIEQIRSVDCSYSINSLIEKGLVEKAGRLDVPGKPTLYKTTEKFLITFDIKSLDELPKLPEADE